MSKFMIDLDDAARARLEVYRAAHGLRSLAEAFRHMLDAAFERLSQDEPLALKALANVSGKHVLKVADRDELKPLVSTAKTVAPQGKTRDTAGKKTPAGAGKITGPIGMDGKPLPPRGPQQKGGKK